MSHVQRLAPQLFVDLLTSLTEQPLTVGPTFRNQINVGTGSVPDALIKQTAFEIYIETKLGDTLDGRQIEAHCDMIAGYKQISNSPFLLGLTRKPLSVPEKMALEKSAAEKGVRFVSTTFYEIAEFLEENAFEFQMGLKELISQYRDFITDKNLSPPLENRLLINPCGITFEENRALNYYFDPPERSKSICKYLGIYKNKTVSLIGLVQCVVTAHHENGNIIVLENHALPWTGYQEGQFTSEFENRLLAAMKSSPFANFEDESLRFYFVDQFVVTDFRKVSKHGIQGHRYFTLDSPLLLRDLFRNAEPSLEDLANALRSKTWE
ncbi:MAG: hypothetical protein AAFR20_09410 [Pseudomonadota bacterium]